MSARAPRVIHIPLLLAFAFIGTACNSVPLFAPSESTVTLTAPTRVLGLGASTELTALVLEQGGTPVQNGTSVRFTTTLGRVEPAETTTRNGAATATFFAGTTSGIAEVRATSGAAGGGDDKTNVLEISVGAAGIDTVTIRANPTSVGPGGGTVNVTATVLAANGRAVSGVPVSFSTTAGTLSSTTATTDASGEASVQLTTNVAATVTASSGGKTSATGAAITVRATPSVTISCQGSGASGTSCSQLASQPVTFTVARGSGSSAISGATLDFGEGTTVSLGTLSSSATLTHTYNTAQTYTATVRASDVNGETTSASVAVNITSRPALALNFTATGGTTAAGTQTSTRHLWTFDANATESGVTSTMVESYTWDFGDGARATTSGDETSHIYVAPYSGPTTVTVTARTTDGRSATARREIIVSYCTAGTAGCQTP